jgi:hypothetical protein
VAQTQHTTPPWHPTHPDTPTNVNAMHHTQQAVAAHTPEWQKAHVTVTTVMTTHTLHEHDGANVPYLWYEPTPAVAGVVHLYARLGGGCRVLRVRGPEAVWFAC